MTFSKVFLAEPVAVVEAIDSDQIDAVATVPPAPATPVAGCSFSEPAVADAVSFIESRLAEPAGPLHRE